LVFDDAHKLLKENKEGVLKIMDEYKDCILKDDVNPQLIVCGNEWTFDIEELYWTFKNHPTVHIGSVQQAIVFSRISLKVHHISQDTSLATLGSKSQHTKITQK